MWKTTSTWLKCQSDMAYNVYKLYCSSSYLHWTLANCKPHYKLCLSVCLTSLNESTFELISHSPSDIWSSFSVTVASIKYREIFNCFTIEILKTINLTENFQWWVVPGFVQRLEIHYGSKYIHKKWFLKPPFWPKNL